MKTFITLLCACACLVITHSSMAQERHPYKKFGIKIGVNHTNMNFQRGYNPSGVATLNSRPMRSFTAGLLMKLPLTQTLSIQPEYLYSSRKSFVQAENKTNQFHYLALPVLIHIKATDKFSLFAGPQADLLIHAQSSNGKESEDVTHDTEERNLSAVAGSQYSITENFFIDVRYLHGINNVGVGQRSDVREFKYQIFEISAGIRF